VSHITNGKLTASHISVRFDGVCDHTAVSRFGADAAVLLAFGGDCGGDAAFDGPFDVGEDGAVEVRVERFVGDAFVGDSVGSGSKSFG
jgi:hypothetical protein